MGLLVVALIACALGSWIWYFLFRAPEYAAPADPAEHFKYGSIARMRGFPLYVWEVLPEIFGEYLPGGLDSLGVLLEPNHAVPIGFGLRTVGYPGITPNCALCHVGSYRRSAGATREIVLGAPAHEFDFNGFNQFVVSCAGDPKFNGATLIRAVEKRHPLGFFEKAFYRWVLIPATRKQVLAGQPALGWATNRPAPGPGRADAFNRIKFTQFKFPDDGSIGTSDYPPLWNQAERAGLWLHWNGSGNVIGQENMLSALQVIGDARAFDAASFARMTNFIRTLPSPGFPFPVNEAASKAGRVLFQQQCADCHAFGSSRVGQTTPLREIGTDPYFLRMWTTNFVTTLNAIDQPPFRFGSIRVSDGYVNTPLDGCWMRAPYLHNGSVPTLWDLLQPASGRPKQFYRGNNVCDPVKVGFLGDVIGDASSRFAFDTTLPGNGNQGHEYGTALSDAEKHTLIEYLKTL